MSEAFGVDLLAAQGEPDAPSFDTIGGLVAHQHARATSGGGSGQPVVTLDSARDFYELTQIKIKNPVTGIFMIGFFTRRVDGFALNVALAFTIALNVYLGLGVMKVLPEAWRAGVHSYWVGAVVSGVPVSTGPIASTTTFTLTVTNAAGATAVYEDHLIQRHFQDIHVISQHLQARLAHYALVGRHALGLPVVALPCGASADGRPLSAQIVGRPFDEATVLRIAHAYEQATDWHARIPGGF